MRRRNSKEGMVVVAGVEEEEIIIPFTNYRSILAKSTEKRWGMQHDQKNRLKKEMKALIKITST